MFLQQPIVAIVHAENIVLGLSDAVSIQAFGKPSRRHALKVDRGIFRVEDSYGT